MLDILRFFGLPLDASTHGPALDQMTAVVHWLMFVLFVGWGSFFAYTLFRFRKSRNPKADYVGVKSHISSYLEVGVAIFEAILLIGFAIPLWAERVNEFPSEADALTIRVVGEQFAWNIHYPGADGKFGRTDIKLVSADNPLGLDREDPDAKDDIWTVNQLNLPVNRPVIIRLTSKDVIHSFALPLFRVKQDAIPGEVIPLWFTPTMTTAQILEASTKRVTISLADTTNTVLQAMVARADFAGSDGTVVVSKDDPITAEAIRLLVNAGITEIAVAHPTPTEIACAQLCGLGHYRMKGFVTIQTEEEFKAWLEEEASYL
jgi:cytochrome c oxidase subunit 2